jgi:hypothetical protein
MTSTASGYVDQPMAGFHNRAFRKGKAGVFSLNQSMMSDLNSLGPGISPVAIHTGAPFFMVSGMALKATVGAAFVKVRPGCPDETQKNG